MEPFFLAKLLGFYFLIMGIITATRRSSLVPAIKELSKNKALVLLIGVIELAAGLGIVLAYPTVSTSWMGLVALIGWTLIIEGIIYLSYSTKVMQNFVRRFNKKSWYLGGGALSILIGLYLLAGGFGAI
jgi:uncharacterized membrane protein HdeD (DUF308 family)